MSSIVLIQARLNSRRLPAKVLLPIKSIPMVVLASKRAANTGKNVLVVTSNEPSDDLLCIELKRYGIPYFRGSLNNTLNRFVSALKTFDDATVVTRLTADNVLPDGSLIDELESYFSDHKLNYLACNGENSGLPYGISVEIMKLGSLREASLSTSDMHDIEHVTPYIKRKFGEVFYQKYTSLKMGAYRCTVDNFDDYLFINKVFSLLPNPTTAPLSDLLKCIKNSDSLIRVKKPIKKLVLGGAQLGYSYGINNKTGKPSNFEAEEIIKTTVANGVQFIDTAQAYGDSEKVIGETLQSGWESRVKVITKLSLPSKFEDDTNSNLIAKSINESVLHSCRNLKSDQLYCLMFHKVSDLYNWHGVAWKHVLQLKKDGLIEHIGASIQSPKELDLVLNHKEINFIQMPFNILDNRWASQIEKIKEVKKERPIIIHARSALLQGLLVSKHETLWKKANVEKPAEIIKWLNTTVAQLNCNSIVELCLIYAKSQEWIDGVVVGMETKELANKNVDIFTMSNLSSQSLKHIDSGKPTLSENTLNPAHWL